MQSIKASGVCPPLLFVAAPDRIRRQRIAEFLEAVAFPDSSKKEVRRVQASEIDGPKITRFLDDLNSLSLFSSFRFVLVEGADTLSAAGTQVLTQFFKEARPGICCICMGAKAPATNALVKLCKQLDTAICFEALEGSELSTWIAKELKTHGITEFEDGLPEAMAHLAEYDADRVIQYIKQVALFVASGRASLADVRCLFRDTLDAREFDFIDALFDRKLLKAEILNSMLVKAGKNQFALLTLLQRQFCTLIGVATLQQAGKTAEEIASELKLQPWLAKKHMQTVRNTPLKRLQRGLRAFIRAESLLKNRSLGTEMVVSSAIHDILITAGVGAR
jgi:DNA polymerase-3 subunit delta